MNQCQRIINTYSLYELRRRNPGILEICQAAIQLFQFRVSSSFESSCKWMAQHPNPG